LENSVSYTTAAPSDLTLMAHRFNHYDCRYRGISLKTLRRGERFRVGKVVFEYRGPRSVCRYIEGLTEPGMTQALKGRGGICATVTKNDTIRTGDEIELL
jgi:MOSC domain-containing protein YiiM